MSIHKKLLSVQAEMPKIEKESINPHFKNKYADLSSVLSIVLPLLHKNGLYHTNEQTMLNDKWVLIVKVVDAESEKFIQTTLPLLNTADMQKLGSCITYAQRYGLLPLLGIAPELDDDGNNASTPAKELAKIPIELTKEEKEIINELKVMAITYKDELIDKKMMDSITEVIKIENIERAKKAIAWVKENIKGAK